MGSSRPGTGRAKMEPVLRYDKWVEEALCHVIRRVLAQVAADGLPDPHHFFITFLTDAPGVVMPESLRAQHPEKITVVIQHQFWGLKVEDDAFEVTLAFQGVNTPLRIPFDAITAFADPGVNFGLQLKVTETEAGEQADDAPPPAPREGSVRGFCERPQEALWTWKSGARRTAPSPAWAHPPTTHVGGGRWAQKPTIRPIRTSSSSFSWIVQRPPPQFTVTAASVVASAPLSWSV